MKKVIEFVMPILKENARMIDDDFMIRGVCISVGETANGITYLESELENSAHTFRDRPILIDHKNEVKSIVGRTTENVEFDFEKNGISFEGRIVDLEIQRKINAGLINEVSIGASVEDIEEIDGKKIARNIIGREISLVAVPSCSSANFTRSIKESFGKEVEIIKENNEPSIVEDIETQAIKDLNWESAFNSDKLAPKLSLFGKVCTDPRAIKHFSK